MRVAEMKKQCDDFDAKEMNCACRRIERRIRLESKGNVSITRGRFRNMTKRLMEERERYTKDKMPKNMRVEYMGKVSMSRSRFKLMKEYILGKTPRFVPRTIVGGMERDFKRDVNRIGVTTRRMSRQEENTRMTGTRWSLSMLDN